MRTLAVIPAVLLLASAVFAQDEPTSALIRRTPVAGQYEGTLWPPVKTDGQGNMYVRLHATDAPIDSTLLRISRDGTRVTKYASSVVPGAVTTFLDFAPSSSGEVYSVHECVRLRGEPPCYLMAHFNATGRYLDSVRMDSWFIPTNIAGFGNGSFLLMVRDYRTGLRDKEPPKTAAIFDKEGHFVRTIRLSDATPGFDRAYQPASKDDSLDAVTLQSADDGSVYVTRFSPSPTVFVISAAGNASRYDLPGLYGSAAQLRAAVISKGKLLAQYDTYQKDPSRADVEYSIGAVCQRFDLNLGMRLPGFRTGGFGTLAAMEGESLLYISAVGQGKYEVRQASIP